ncbi:MAG: hypothetical protein NZ763_05710 [Candidatus Marinimicrobia bacterium]|nr:hypothetical protein [Candidatus Neomarinimicrobiota bacterium]
MEEVTLDIKGQGVLRLTEIISDLRIVAETFYGPMKMVGFWDYQKDMHLCPQMERRQACPHSLQGNDQNFVSYISTLERERHCNFAVSFPHAEITLYLS